MHTCSDVAQVLVIGLPALSAQAQVHDRRAAADRALGARGGARTHAGSPQPAAAGGARAAADGEHPFGTLKSWMGATHFLMRTLPKVRTEMSLHVLAYNMKRVIKLLGTASLIQAIQA